MVEQWKCNHDSRAVCICCSWNAQPWWPEARQKALDTGLLKMDDLSYHIYLLVKSRRPVAR